MAKEEKAIFTNLCMITDSAGNVLVEDRVDKGWPGVCFPGGHVKPGESFTQSVIREVREETGLTVLDPVLCGVKQFPTNGGARYVVFFYRATRYTGTLESSDEGRVFWIPREALFSLNVVEDFREMVQVMETPTLSEFYYYKDGENWGLPPVLNS